jgi:DNA-binding transcriptional LysR family regulator
MGSMRPALLTRSLSLAETDARYLRRIEAVVEELDDAGTEAHAGSATAVGILRITASVAFDQVF